MKKIILASASPRRKDILNEVGIKPLVITSMVDESVIEGLSPEKAVMELALLKGAAVAKMVEEDAVVIGADTVVVLDGEILGKPESMDEATQMLKKLSGKWHSVLTGYCVIDAKSGEACAKYEETKVKFRELDNGEINRYVNSHEPMDKAGSYGIQGKGRLFVEKIDGDYFNVVGLPVCALGKMLKSEFGIDIL